MFREQYMKQLSGMKRQQGLSLTGLILILIVVGLIAVVGMKVVPTFTEYMSIKKAIASVKAAGGSIPEMRNAFNRQAEVGYIDAISGNDLDIVKNGDDADISFSYQKTIPLAGPVSLLINYEGSTSSNKSAQKPIP
jgi:type II secretory pathway pseudopilin PulG